MLHIGADEATDPRGALHGTLLGRADAQGLEVHNNPLTVNRDLVVEGLTEHLKV